jgi:hypothetical protein
MKFFFFDFIFKDDFDVLNRALSGSNLTKAKCCFLMGHMTKSSRTFCTILKSHPDVLDQLRQCCFEEDSHVRKVEKKKKRKSLMKISFQS